MPSRVSISDTNWVNGFIVDPDDSHKMVCLIRVRSICNDKSKHEAGKDELLIFSANLQILHMGLNVRKPDFVACA